MRTARRYLAREIFRSTSVVVVALLGLFTFFTLVDELDTVGERFPLAALFYLQMLCGVIRGALEMIQMSVECKVLKCISLGDKNTEIRVKLLRIIDDELPPSD